MPSREIAPVEDADGNLVGVEIRFTDDGGTERAISWTVGDNGNVTERSEGPSGVKEGTRDPSGGGSDSLGV